MLILLNITQSCTCFLGEAAAVPVLQRSEGAGVADGVSHSLHQGDRRPPRKGGSVSRPEERTGECSLTSPIRLIICRRTLVTRLVMTLRWVPWGRSRAPLPHPTPHPRHIGGHPRVPFYEDSFRPKMLRLIACRVLTESALQPLGCRRVG